MKSAALSALGQTAVERPLLQRLKVRIGDPAYAFELPRADVERRAQAELVRLADYLTRQPVALVFGSCTCPRVRAWHEGVEALAVSHGDAVAFLFVYVREAHAVGRREIAENRSAGISVKDPIDSASRLRAACDCAVRLGIRMPVLVDSTEDRVTAAYRGWPNGLCLIGRTGIVRFQSRVDHVRQLERAIRRELGWPWWRVWV